MRAEHEIGVARIFDPRDGRVYRLHHRIQVRAILVEFLDRHDPRVPPVGLKPPPPLVQTAARSGLGILRIERQQHYPLGRVAFQQADRFLGEWVPIPHRHHHPRVEFRPERRFQRCCLPRGVLQDRTPPADLRVVMLHVARPRGGDQLRQRLPRDPGEREIDDVRVAKQVVKERFDTLQRIRPAQLKKNYP